MKVRDAVNIQPDSVQKLADEAESIAKKRRKKAPKPVEPPVETWYTKRPAWVSVTAWAVARTLAEGDHKRMRVESATSILVMNR